MSHSCIEEELVEARDMIIREWLQEYGSYPTPEEIEMELESFNDWFM